MTAYFRHFRFWFSALLCIVVMSFVSHYFVSPYWETVLAYAAVNIILAVSLNLVNGFTGQFALGHAGLMAVGAYSSAALTTLILPASILSFASGHFAFFLSVLLSGLSAGFVGFLVGAPSLRLRGDYLAIATLGFGEIIRICILNIEAVGGARGMIGIPRFATMPWLFALTVLICIFVARLISSVVGKQFMAVRDDETATLAMGLSTTKIKVRAFVLSSAIAGIAGAIFAHYSAYLNPQTFNFNYSFQILAMVVLGGLGSLSGSIVAAVGLTFLLEALRPLQEITRFDFRMVIYSVILIVLMLTRPQGLLGRREVWAYFSRGSSSARPG